MSRLLPHPIISIFLLIMWLLLYQSLALGHLILGAVLGVAGGLVLSLLDIPPQTVRRFRAIVKLTLLVLSDMIRSNIAVGRIILGGQGREITSGFMTIPLTLRAPYGHVALATLITFIPGTLWVNFDSSQGELTIHVLELLDEDELRSMIKERYEVLLLEIYE